jgi:hypothetical protein
VTRVVELRYPLSLANAQKLGGLAWRRIAQSSR